MFTFKDYRPNRIGFNNYEDSEGVSDGVWQWMVDQDRFGRIGEVREDIKTIHNEDGELIGTLMPIELRYDTLSVSLERRGSRRSKVKGYILWNSSYRNLSCIVGERATDAEAICPIDVSGSRNHSRHRHNIPTVSYDDYGNYIRSTGTSRVKIRSFIQTIIVPEKFVLHGKDFEDYMYSQNPLHNGLHEQVADD